MSPKEMSFDGGFTDNSAPRVMGSYPQNSMTNVPKDMTFIGFNFDKSLQSGTIASASATTSVTLKAGGTGANLCVSVTYNPMPGNFEPSVKCIITAGTHASTSYTFEIGASGTSAIRDISGNQMDTGFVPARHPILYRYFHHRRKAYQTMTNMVRLMLPAVCLSPAVSIFLKISPSFSSPSAGRWTPLPLLPLPPT